MGPAPGCRRRPPSSWSQPVHLPDGAVAAPVASAAAFGLEYRLGGSDALPAGPVAAGMVAAHLGVAAVEAVVTAGVLAAVQRHRPSLIGGVDRAPVMAGSRA